MEKKGITHYLFTYDLLEYNLKDVYDSFVISYFTMNDNIDDGIIDENELREYESVENNKHDVRSILIRKFKLRISIKKDVKFSKDIIVSDTYDFDCSTLSHPDSLLKIAIAKDNIDEWLKLDYLKDYDFIFTSDEHLDALKKNHEHVFAIEGESKYLQFKNILNFIYIRKNSKFFKLLNRLQEFFPNWSNYFKIFHSPYYDEEWYKEKYEITDNVDPVLHYLLIGYRKEFDPGPEFSTYEYYDCNKDVRKNGMNPLVHYEVYGRKSKRHLRLTRENMAEDIELVGNSPYFDEKWYEDHYGITEEHVYHYLRYGYKEGYDPGPDFSTAEYYACNKDVEEFGMNPLRHYEVYGRKEKRKIRLDS